jgi:hypothetical protein
MRENGTQGRALRLFRAFPALLYRRWINQANSRFSRPFAAKDYYLRYLRKSAAAPRSEKYG